MNKKNFIFKSLTDDEIYDAKVKDFLVRIFVGELFLLLLDLPHQLLRLLVLRRHDVRHAQVRQHDRGHVQNAERVQLQFAQFSFR